MKWSSHDALYKEMTSKEKYGDLPNRMDFPRANSYLQDLKKVFNQVGIRFFLFYGTLIGAIRDHDFSWRDDDVDVGIFFEDAHKLIEVEKIFKEMGYYTCFGPLVEDKRIYGYIAKKGFREKVDFYTLFSFQGERCFYRYTRNDITTYIPYPQKFFDNLKEIEFKGEKYFVPNPPEDFLTLLWGNWKVPKGGQWGIIKHKEINKELFKHEGA